MTGRAILREIEKAAGEKLTCSPKLKRILASELEARTRNGEDLEARLRAILNGHFTYDPKSYVVRNKPNNY